MACHCLKCILLTFHALQNIQIFIIICNVFFFYLALVWVHGFVCVRAFSMTFFDLPILEWNRHTHNPWLYSFIYRQLLYSVIGINLHAAIDTFMRCMRILCISELTIFIALRVELHVLLYHCRSLYTAPFGLFPTTHIMAVRTLLIKFIVKRFIMYRSQCMLSCTTCTHWKQATENNNKKE